MPSKKYTVTAGFVEAVDEALKNHADEIKKGGADPDVLRARLAGPKVDMTTKEAVKDDAVRDAGVLVGDAEKAVLTCYDEGSSVVDAASGAVGKKSALGKQLLALRSQATKAIKPRVSKAKSAGKTGTTGSNGAPA